MADNITYKITIEGAGLSLDREVPKEIGEQVVVLLLTGAAPVTQAAPAPLQSVNTPVTAAPAPPQTHHVPHTPQQHVDGHPDTSIREFLDSCEAKRAPDKITAIGNYLKIHNHQPDFDKNDLISHFESAAEPVPKNITRDLKWTLKAGWIALKNGSKDRYYITNSGKTAVEQKFSKEVVKKTRGLVPSGTKRQTSAKDTED